MTYIITKEIEFDAGHRVPLHASKCRNPHGHRYRVQAGIEGELITEGPESGMVRDFSIVKELLTEHVHDIYDHGFIVHKSDKDIIDLFNTLDYKIIVVDWYPTAECLAKNIYWRIKTYLPTLQFIRIWETPTSMAEYKE